MQYDWKKIVEEQKESTLSTREYCKQNNIPISSFYRQKKSLENDTLENNLFVPVKIIHEPSSHISMNIDGHYLEFDPILLDKIIGALK